MLSAGAPKIYEVIITANHSKGSSKWAHIKTFYIKSTDHTDAEKQAEELFEAYEFAYLDIPSDRILTFDTKLVN